LFEVTLSRHSMDDLSGGVAVTLVVIRTPELHSNNDLSGCRVIVLQQDWALAKPINRTLRTWY
jgi:hypothetical protein